jgi:hypothetical protein
MDAIEDGCAEKEEGEERSYSNFRIPWRGFWKEFPRLPLSAGLGSFCHKNA